MLGIEPQEELASARSPEELDLAGAAFGGQQGTLEEPTAELLEKSLEFGELRADDVMTPRVKVKTLSPDEPVMAVVEAARSGGHSRFPVITEGSEMVEGIVHVKHAVGVEYDRRQGRGPIRDVMAVPVLVPSTRSSSTRCSPNCERSVSRSRSSSTNSEALTGSSPSRT